MEVLYGIAPSTASYRRTKLAKTGGQRSIYISYWNYMSQSNACAKLVHNPPNPFQRSPKLTSISPPIYVCMHACVHACMYVCMYVCTYVRTYVCMYVCTYVYKGVCAFVCMYVCVMCVESASLNRWASD